MKYDKTIVHETAETLIRLLLSITVFLQGIFPPHFFYLLIFHMGRRSVRLPQDTAGSLKCYDLYHFTL